MSAVKKRKIISVKKGKKSNKFSRLSTVLVKNPATIDVSSTIIKVRKNANRSDL